MRKVTIILAIVCLTLVSIAIIFEQQLFYREDNVQATYSGGHLDTKSFFGVKWGYSYTTFLTNDCTEIKWHYRREEEKYYGNVIFICRTGLLTKRKWYIKIEPRNKYQ